MPQIWGKWSYVLLNQKYSSDTNSWAKETITTGTSEKQNLSLRTAAFYGPDLFLRWNTPNLAAPFETK